jgi:hypothetical protein
MTTIALTDSGLAAAVGRVLGAGPWDQHALASYSGNLVVHDATSLEELKLLPALRRLEVIRSKLTPAGVPSLPELEELHMRQVDVPDFGFLSGLPKLSALWLHFVATNNIGPALHHPAIRRLSLRGLPLSEDDWRSLFPALLTQNRRVVDLPMLHVRLVNGDLVAAGMPMCVDFQGRGTSRRAIWALTTSPPWHAIAVDMIELQRGLAEFTNQGGDWKTAFLSFLEAHADPSALNLEDQLSDDFEVGDAAAARTWCQTETQTSSRLHLQRFIANFPSLTFFRFPPGSKGTPLLDEGWHALMSVLAGVMPNQMIEIQTAGIPPHGGEGWWWRIRRTSIADDELRKRLDAEGLLPLGEEAEVSRGVLVRDAKGSIHDPVYFFTAEDPTPNLRASLVRVAESLPELLAKVIRVRTEHEVVVEAQGDHEP